MERFYALATRMALCGTPQPGEVHSDLASYLYISKSIDLLWDAVAAVAAVVTHSASVPQTYPPRPQHAHSSPARIHSTTEPRLSTATVTRAIFECMACI